MWPAQHVLFTAMGLLLVCPNNAREVCSNGVPGVEGFGVCCAAECGTCGGVNCKNRAEAAGLTADFCCAGRIISDSGVYCDDFEIAPCIIAPTCSNGVVGIEDFGVCCMAECGTCGGAGCSDRAEAAGLNAHGCCSQSIMGSGVYCDQLETAPCIIHEACEPSLVITLEWSDGLSDVDLYVIEPDGTIVSYERPLGNFGFLEEDDEDGFGPENYIILSGLDPDNSPVLGDYQAQARLFDGPTESWNLTARTFGEVVLSVEGDFMTSNTTQYFNVPLTSYDPNCGGRFAA